MSVKYRNPIIPGFHPDPSICRVKDDYYLVTSSFEYFPGVPIFHSRNLVDWEHIGYCLTRNSQLPLDNVGSSGGIWAPTLRYHEGRFYMITTNQGGGGHFFVYTDDINGEWSDPVWVEGGGHDPDLFFDEDGKVYFSRYNSDTGITLWEIDIKTGRLIGEGKPIWPGFEDVHCEAPHLYKINGMYYLIVAEGGTWRGHMVVAARSDKPTGPFEGCPHNPILTHRHVVMSEIQSLGHGDLVQTQNGDWWIVFLGTRQVNRCHHLGRETFLAPVTWTEDGWPVVNRNNIIDAVMECNGLPGTIPKERRSDGIIRDDFDQDKLANYWNFRRNPSDTVWSLKEKPGYLTIKGDAATLNDMGFKSFIGRRQQHFNCVARAKLDFEARAEGDEAGLTVIMNESHHYEFGILNHKGKRYVIIRKTVGDITHIDYCGEINKDSIILEISADHHTYTMGFSMDGQEYSKAGTARTRYVSSEVAGGFTGVYIGMYATGNGRKASVPACYDWFEYSWDE